MQKRVLDSIMSQIKGKLISIDQLLDSHKKSVASRKCYIEVQSLEDVKLPLNNVLLGKLWVSRSSFNHIFERRRINLFVFLSDEKATKRHFMKILLLTAHLLNG